jgi:GNAT superfamily N-acetyltransferase
MSNTFNWSQLERADAPAGAPPATEPVAEKQTPGEGFDWKQLESAQGAPAAGVPQADANIGTSIWSQLTPVEQPQMKAPGTSSDDIWNKLEPVNDPRNVTDRYRDNASTLGLSADERAYGQTPPDKMEDEPWYSKAWEWMNSPLYDLHNWGTRENAGTFERGLETGLEDIGSGFLTPLQLGLTLATFGGSAVEAAGISAIRTLGVTAEAAPIVARTAKGLMTAGFTVDMLHGLMTQSPQFLDALKDGDTENATRLGTNILAAGLFIKEGLKHGIEDMNAVKNYVKGKDLTTTDRLKLAAELSGLYDQNKSMGADKARTRMQDIIQQLQAAGVTDKTTEAGIRHFMTQDGDVDRIAKMVGIAEGTIKAREYTPEEKTQIEGAVELRKWASESSPAVLKENGTPQTFYVTDSAEGTHQLGQTLATSGDTADAHYVQMKKPVMFDSEGALKAYVNRIGKEMGIEDPKDAQAAAVQTLLDAGHDGIIYKDTEGKAKLITFDDEQYRPVETYKGAADIAWNREHVFYAVDKKYRDQVLNAGVKSPARREIQYHATPEEALKNAVLPDSGNKKDLAVFSVPRKEVELGIHIDKTNEALGERTGIPEHADLLEKKGGIQYIGEKPYGFKGIDKGLAEKDYSMESDGSREYRIRAVDKNNNHVGTIVLALNNDDIGGKAPTATVRAVKVSDDFQHRGIGTNLYEQAARVASSLGARELTSDTVDTSDAAAGRWRSLRDKRGYKIKEASGNKFKWDLHDKNITAQELKPFDPNAEPFGPRALTKTPEVADTELITKRSHMPGHELELDENMKPTGRSTPLRPIGAEDLPGDPSRFQNAYTPAEKTAYIDGLKKAMSLSDEQKSIARSLRQLYDNSFQRAWDHGLIRQWVEAYHPQAWASEDNSLWNQVFGKDKEKVTNGSLNDLRSDTNSGRFDTNINQAKHRAFMTEFQGIMAGEKFRSDDLAVHAYNHMRAIEHAVAARSYIDDLRAKSLRASDGRPAAVLAGTSRVMGKETNNPAVAISPRSIKPLHISPEKIQAMREGINPRTNMTDLDEALQNGTIEKLPWTVDAEGPDGQPRKESAYAYSTEGYVSIDHPAMRGWGFSGVDTAGNPAILNGNIMVHPDFATEVRRVVGAEKSIVRESPVLSGINRAAGEAKGLLLSISPFHIVQEGLRAAMMGISPFEAGHIDINSNPSLQLGVKNGLVRNDFRAKDKFSTGYASHSKLISAIPGLNRFQGWMQEFLFDKYIPSLKDRAFLKMFGDMRDQYPRLTADEAASRTADTVNDVFGGQNWRKLGVSASQQDFMRMSALAPDWLLSEVRMLGRAAGLMDKESGAYSRKMLAKQVASIWVAARVLNLLINGQMHNEAPFGVASKNDKGEETVYSVRTLPTDLIHAMSDPAHFIAGRVNPLTVRPVVEGLTGRDAMGRRAPWDTQAKDLIRNIVPIAGQGLIRGGEMSTFDQIVKGGGFAVSKYRTEAEKLAQQYASDRMPSGPVDPANLAKHQEDIRLEDALRKGQIGRGDLLQKLSKRRADEIIRRAPMSPLQARFDRLPLSESVNVWDAATNSEKDELKSLLWKKRASYIKQHSVREREEDPTWRKIQSIYADLRR